MLRKVLIVFALGCALTVAQDVKVGGIPPEPISTDSPTSSSPPITKGTTTPTSTPAPHSNTTAAPTSPPPTTQPPPASTTEPPAPSTTLAPPTKHHYVVKAGNETCLLADLTVLVNFVENNKTWEINPTFNVSSSNVSSCSNETQELPLIWKDMDRNYSLNFQFVKNETHMKFMVSRITLNIATKNGTFNLFEDNPMFTASVSKSYRCEKEQDIKLAEEGDNTNTTYAVLKLSHLQFEAFHTGSGETFSAAEDCAGGSSPDIVPIAVGCALVGLIAIVLIAYLVGRRRSQARGYLSM